MNALTKGIIWRFLKRFGIRILKEAYYRFEYDRENYPEVAKCLSPIIFDVGANIGQSAIWFSKNFPTAQIHAFEPVPSVFRRLEREVSGERNIKALNLACGKLSKVIYIPSTNSELIQTLQVLGEQVNAGEGDRVTVATIDDYCETNQIPSIQILKTDTEGYDLDVLQGAARMLSAGRIAYVLSEVTIFKDDPQHTNLFKLIELLEPFGFMLISFYGLQHAGSDGRLNYFNALFHKNADS